MRIVILLFALILSNPAFGQLPLFKNGEKLIDSTKGILDVGYNSACGPIDFNNDGLLDLVVGNHDGYLLLYLNHGTVHTPKFTSAFPLQLKEEDLKVSFNAKPAFADLNGDACKDLIVGTGSGKIYFYRNYGPDESPKFLKEEELFLENSAALSAGFLGEAAPAAMDLNRDGLLDIIVGTKKGEILFFLNNGKKGWPVFEREPSVLGFELGQFTTPYATDWDKDGFLDVIVGNSEGEVLLLKNSRLTRPPYFFSPIKIREASSYIDLGLFSTPALADIDGDGQKDLIGGEVRGQIFLYPNVSLGKEPSFLAKKQIPKSKGPLDVGRWAAVCVVDADYDGKKDIISGCEEGDIYFFKNSGTKDAPLFGEGVRLKAKRKNLDVGRYSTPMGIDFDRDGRLDLLVGNYEGDIFLYSGQGSRENFPTFSQGELLKAEYGDIDVGLFSSPFMADLNGDKKDDLLVGDIGGYANLFLNKGTKYEPRFDKGFPISTVEGKNLKVAKHSAPVVADLDKDGLLDLIVGDEEGRINLFPNFGAKEKPRFAYQIRLRDEAEFIHVPGHAALSIVDLNDDGVPDIVAGDSLGRIQVFWGYHPKEEE
ncbi:VCBS repeat-containing protein [bacterium]|nr:VCBS repeat-containing protein [bacterium]